MKISASIFALALVAFLSLVPVGTAQDKSKSGKTSSAVGDDIMYGRLDQFFKLVGSGKVTEGYQALVKGSKSITNVEPLVKQTEEVIKGNGNIVGVELLRTTRVGKRLLRISYLTHGEVYPMKWNFYCYQSNSGWQVLDITVNNNLYDIFDEEEKEQKAAREKATRK